MSPAEYNVRVEGLEEMQRALRDYPQIAERVMRRTMSEATTKLESAVKQEMTVAVPRGQRGAYSKPIDQGRLFSAIQGRVETGGFTFDSGGVQTIRGVVDAGNVNYAIYVEIGRRPGRQPPLRNIMRWVHLKLKVPPDRERSVAYLVARSIGRHGTRGYFMFARAWRKTKPWISAHFKRSLKDLVREIARRARV